METLLAFLTVKKAVSVVYLLAVLVFIFVIYKVSKDPANKFHWIQSISNPDGSASLTRILQFGAGVTATWVIVKQTMAGALSTEMFLIYLAAMGLSEAYTKFLQAKESK